MHRLSLLGFIWLFSCLSSGAGILTNGLPMTEVINAMKTGGYRETGLDMMARPGSGMGLRFWGVGEGVLIIGYSIASQKISEITFWLADDRPKATRQTFELDVTSFDTQTGTMVIRTKKGEPGGAGNPGWRRPFRIRGSP